MQGLNRAYCEIVRHSSCGPQVVLYIRIGDLTAMDGGWSRTRSDNKTITPVKVFVKDLALYGLM